MVMAALPVAAIMFLTFMPGIQTDIQEFSDDVTVEMLLNATPRRKILPIVVNNQPWERDGIFEMSVQMKVVTFQSCSLGAMLDIRPRCS